MPERNTRQIIANWGFGTLNVLLNGIVIFLLLQIIGNGVPIPIPFSSCRNAGEVISEDRISNARLGEWKSVEECQSSKIISQTVEIQGLSADIRSLWSAVRLWIAGFWFFITGYYRFHSDYWMQISGLWILQSF